MLKHLLQIAILSVVSLNWATAQETESGTAFEGRIDYEISSEGSKWTYSLWLKQDLWRAELRQGPTLYELRMGNSRDLTGFLVNEGGKAYRPLNRRGPEEGDRPRGGDGDRRSVDLTKIVTKSDKEVLIAGFTARLDVLKGAGSKMDVWTSSELGTYSGLAIPLLKKTQEKAPVFIAYFREFQGVPLLIEESGKSGKKAFQFKAIAVTRMSVEDSFLNVPEDFKLQGGGTRARPSVPGPGNGSREGKGRRSGGRSR